MDGLHVMSPCVFYRVSDAYFQMWDAALEGTGTIRCMSTTHQGGGHLTNCKSMQGCVGLRAAVTSCVPARYGTKVFCVRFPENVLFPEGLEGDVL